MALPARLRSGQQPVGVFDNKTVIGGQDKIARLACDDLKSVPLQEWNKWGQPGGTDLLA